MNAMSLEATPNYNSTSFISYPSFAVPLRPLTDLSHLFPTILTDVSLLSLSNTFSFLFVLPNSFTHAPFADDIGTAITLLQKPHALSNDKMEDARTCQLTATLAPFNTVNPRYNGQNLAVCNCEFYRC
jgi:hypothetical protein